MKLNFFIRPLGAEHTRRLLVAHVTRGIWYELNTGNSASALRHVLGLFDVLPLPDLAAKTSLSSGQRKQLITYAALCWPHKLDRLRLGTHEFELECLKQSELETAFSYFNLFASKDQLNQPTNDQPTIMTNTNIPQEVIDKLSNSLAALEASLLAKDVMMPQHLRNTHSVLINYPESVHLLKDAEIALIISAAATYTQTEIVKAASKPKRATQLTLSDL